MKLLDWLLPRKSAAPHTFHGGLHVPGHKALSTAQPSRELPLADTYYLSLRQRNGLLQTPIVAVGERVLRGQTVTLENGVGSVPRHAPTSGTVIAIADHDDIHASGQNAPAIIIAPDGLDESAPALPALDWQNTPVDTLLERIHHCGISGLGGAGFPSARKLKHQNRTLVVNAAECEPYITCDDMQIRECVAEIVSGAQIAAHIIGADVIHFGIEDDKPHAIDALKRAIAEAQDPRIRLTIVPTRYPSGNSRQLFELLLGIRVPTDRHAAEYGLVCHNSATIKAIHDAIRLGLPLTERYVTLTGEALASPQVVRTRFGTPIDWLIAQAGGAQPDARLIIGGPMMGHPQTVSRAGLKKTSNCLLLLPATPAPREENCIRCARCADACPMELLPQQLYWYSRNGQNQRLTQYRLFDCIECGICASVCPSAIPLVDYYRHSKAAIREETRKQTAADHAKARHDAREARLAREAAEREAKMAAKRAALQQRSPSSVPENPDTTTAPETSTIHPLAPLGDSSELAKRERGRGEGAQTEGLSETSNEPATTPQAHSTPPASTSATGVNTATPQPFNPTQSAPASPDKTDAIAAAKARAAARKAARQQQSTESERAEPVEARTEKHPAPETSTNHPLAPLGDSSELAKRERGRDEGVQAEGLSETPNKPALPHTKPVEAQPQTPPVSTSATDPDAQPPTQEDPLAAAKARAAARKAARMATQSNTGSETSSKSKTPTDQKPLSLRERGWGEGSKNTTTMLATPEPATTPQSAPTPPVSTSATGPDAQLPTQEDPLAAAKARAAARKAARQQQNTEPKRAEPVEAQPQTPPTSTSATSPDAQPPTQEDPLAAAKARAAARKAARLAQNKDKPHE